MRLLFAALLHGFTMMAAAETARIPLRIEIATAGDHLRVHFHAARPVAEIRLLPLPVAELDATWRSIRHRRWLPVGTGWQDFDGAIIRSDGATFQDADLDIFPDDRRENWIKPGVFQIGDSGFVLFTRYLQTDLSRFAPELVFRPRSGETINCGESPVHGEARQVLHDYTREVYIGPKSAVRKIEGMTVVVAPDAPPWMAERLAGTVARAAALFQRRIGLRDPVPPTLMLALLDDGRIPSQVGWIGKAEYGSVLTLRIFSPLYRSAWPGPQASLDEVVAHEVFHLWDGIDYHAQGEGAAWLEEGGAVYASLRARRLLGIISEGDERRELDRHIAHCREWLGDKGLRDFRGFDRYETVYSCGALIYWIADLALWQESGGARDVFSLWHGLLGRGRGYTYSAEQLISRVKAYSPAATDAMALILDPHPAGRWTELGRRMAAFGVRTGPGAPAWIDMQKALIQHLFKLDCQGLDHALIHFNGEVVRMDTTAQACPHLGDAPDIVAVEGFLPVTQADSAYAAMTVKCGAGGLVDVALQNGTTFGLACSKPLDPLAAATDGFGVQ